MHQTSLHACAILKIVKTESPMYTMHAWPWLQWVAKAEKAADNMQMCCLPCDLHLLPSLLLHVCIISRDVLQQVPNGALIVHGDRRSPQRGR